MLTPTVDGLQFLSEFISHKWMGNIHEFACWTKDLNTEATNPRATRFFPHNADHPTLWPIISNGDVVHFTPNPDRSFINSTSSRGEIESYMGSSITSWSRFSLMLLLGLLWIFSLTIFVMILLGNKTIWQSLLWTPLIDWRGATQKTTFWFSETKMPVISWGARGGWCF